MSEEKPERDRRRRSILKEYYGMDVSSSGDNGDPYNINGAHFNPDMYLEGLIKKSSLTHLMEKESEIIEDIQKLDSDMQTLVYDNYNKFISATDTIRKMKNDFKKMEDEMDLLGNNMESITKFSAQISDTLQDRRQQISKLSSVHSLLKKLQFLFKLPTKLNTYMEEGNYNQAVKDYTHAQRVLEQYRHLPSFHGIQGDCETLITELKQKLRDQFKSKEATPQHLAESVDLLLQLQEPAESLCSEFLSHASDHLKEDLATMEKHLQFHTTEDMIEFVDLCCNTFLSDICLVIASYSDMFVNRDRIENFDGRDTLEEVATQKLAVFVPDLMQKYFTIVEQRVVADQDNGDSTILVHGLDRFHRRVEAMNKLLPDLDFARSGTGLVVRASHHLCRQHFKLLCEHFTSLLSQVRQSLAAPKVISQDGDNSGLGELLTSLVAGTAEKIKTSLNQLQPFLQPDLTFAQKPHFRNEFCQSGVREGVVVAFLRHIATIANSFCDVQDKAPPSLLLLLSRMCYDFETSTVHYILTLTDKQFNCEDVTGLTPLATIRSDMKSAAQRLLDHYVRVQGLGISQMLRKSVEARDWLHTIEPRKVRSVMKRVVEDVSAIDVQVGALYEEGQRQARSSDSSRKTRSMSVSRHQMRSTWSSYTSSQLDSSLVNNIQKIFSEPIEIFAPVECSKVSILTGIIKISLKTFLECVRLRTFSRFGLQQVQVDTHYLQLYLWRFVSDENLVHFLLDEILGSAILRCLDPVLMELSVVDVICDRG